MLPIANETYLKGEKKKKKLFTKQRLHQDCIKMNKALDSDKHSKRLYEMNNLSNNKRVISQYFDK